MNNSLNKIVISSCCLFFLLQPASSHTFESPSIDQSLLEKHQAAAFDYYVSAMIEVYSKFGESDIYVESVQQWATSYFIMAQSNPDGVISARDQFDSARIWAAAYDRSGVDSLSRYDLDGNAVVTQEELDICFSKDAWRSSRGLKLGSDTYENALERFRASLAAKTTGIREQAGVAAEGDIALKGTVDRTVTWRDEIRDVNSILPQYFALFDTNNNNEVSVDEFLHPIVEGIESADTDGDGRFSEAELNEIKLIYENSDELLKPFTEKYSLKLDL